MLLSRGAAGAGSSAHGLRSCRLLRTSRDAVLRRTGGPGLLSAAAERPWSLASRLTGGAHGQVRGKKTRTVVKLEDLPQGVIKSEAAPAAEADEPAAAPTYPTVVLQARRHMNKFDNCVLLTRVGGFYEMYFEHAQEYGPLLNLKVASKKTNAGPVPMAGFPFFQLDRFLKILVQDLSRYVAVADEFPNDAAEKVRSGGLMHDRRVTRIITPGTLIDENFMDPYASNYVMAIHLPECQQSRRGDAPTEPAQDGPSVAPSSPSSDLDAQPLGLAWLDLSTGQFYTQATTLPSLSAILSRVAPREMVLDQALQAQSAHALFAVLAEDRHLVTYAPPGGDGMRTPADWAPLLEAELSPAAAASFADDEVRAGSLLLRYVGDRLQGLSMKLRPPLRYQSLEVMTIDKNSMRALEIKQTIRDGAFRGSLLHAIRRTVTKSGARLLNEWLSAPSTSPEIIHARQDLVARFLRDETLRESVVLLLGRTHDTHRLVQKFALGRGDPDDLLDLAKTIRATRDIAALLADGADASAATPDPLAVMAARINLDGPLALARRIQDSVDEEGLVRQHRLDDSEAGELMALAASVVSAEGAEDAAAALPKKAAAAAAAAKKRPTSLREHYAEDGEAWTMRPGASPNLTRLHADLAALGDEKTALAETLRRRLGAASLTLRWTPGLGHVCHIKGKDTQRLAAAAAGRTLSARRTTRSFHDAAWAALGARLDTARLHVRAEEARVFAALRAAVVGALVRLRRNAAVLDELDVAGAFARLAAERRLVRPLVTRGAAHHIVGGRHPTVEGGLTEAGRSFTANDCRVGCAGQGRAWLVTGPNMAGKSTFLRQNALITVLAQVGAYVPADYAEVGIVDAIYSRVGSADNLYRDQSTFMVEMLETAAILRHATPRSFVIMDEIGRGTTPEDGAAVAYAALHHLATVNRCRTLFATHFHSLADMAAAECLTVGSAGGQGAIEMYCTDVKENRDGSFSYVHKLRKGINRQSHALKVARLAGLPERAIDVAKRVLDASSHDAATEPINIQSGGETGGAVG